MATALSSLSISSYHYHPLLHPLPKSLSISLSFPLHSPVPLPPPHHHSFPRLKSDRKFRTLTLASFSFANSSDDMFSFGDSWANSPKVSFEFSFYLDMENFFIYLWGIVFICFVLTFSSLNFVVGNLFRVSHRLKREKNR